MRKLMRRKVVIPVVLLVVLVVAGIAAAMSSNNYDLSWNTGTSSSGGDERESANYRLVDTIGQIAPGTSSSGNYQLKAGFLSVMPLDSMITLYVILQGENRPAAGWEVPLTVCFCPENSDDSVLLNPGQEVPCFVETAVAKWFNGGTKATVTVGPVSFGTYDITVDSSTTLLNVKKGVQIQ